LARRAEFHRLAVQLRHHVIATGSHCDNKSAGTDATDRLAGVDHAAHVSEGSGGSTGDGPMSLLLVYIASLIVGQSVAVSIGLLVDRHYSSYAGLMIFMALYFLIFWAAWRFALRVTNPKSQ
jgi:hypothetical protein